MILWPRIPLPRARALAGDLAPLSNMDLRKRRWNDPALRLFAPTGGVPVDDATLRALRAQFDNLALASGFPTPLGRQSKIFDSALIQMLADYPFSFGEAVRAEMWAWICLILVPHLVHWRWADANGNVKTERYAGGLVRNAFGRLWYQGLALDRGTSHSNRWLFSDHFGADQAVSLLERTGLSANRNICLAVGSAWVALPHAARTEHLFRETMKALLVRAAVQRLDALDEATVALIVAETFALASARSHPM